jgi:hypothetical protein
LALPASLRSQGGEQLERSDDKADKGDDMTLALILIFIGLEMAALQRRLRRLRQQREPIIIETYRRRETFYARKTTRTRRY